jgi:hypothetical protein
MERNQTKSTDEELDLVYYFGKFREGLNKVKEWLGSYWLIIWKNFAWFLFIVLLGTGAAFSVRYIIPPAYQTNALLVSHYLPANYYQLMVQDLNQLLDKKNLPTVAEQLQINPEAAAHIVSMKLKPLRDTLLERGDTIAAPFQLTLLLKEMRALDKIQAGLILYLEGGKNKREKKPEKPKSMEATQETLYEKIEVVQPFLKRATYNYPDYNRYLIIGFLASLVIAILLTPLIGKRR